MNNPDTSPMPEDHKLASILVAFFFPITGIIALIHSGNVETQYNMGNLSSSIEESHKTKRWIIISLITGPILFLLLLPLYFFLALIL